MNATRQWWETRHDGQAEAEVRAQILAGRVAPAVKDRLREIYATADGLREITKHVTDTENVASDVVGEVAQVYTVQPRRFLLGATGEQERAFRELVAETGIVNLCPEWSRKALFVGPVTVLPVIETDDLAGVVLRLHSHDADVTEHRVGASRSAFPAAVAVIEPGEGMAKPARVMEVDAVGVYWMDGSGAQTRPPEYHNLDVVPASIFRATDPLHDYWSLTIGHRARAATIDAGVQWAALGYTRKSQSRKLLVANLGDEAGSPGGQTLDPELALELPVDGKMQAIDLEVDPGSFLAHIAAIKSSALRGYGVSDADLSHMSGLAVSVTLARKMALRQQQIEWMTPAEIRMWRVALGVISQSEHRHAKLFANWRDLDVRVEFPELRLADDPTTREAIYMTRAARGAASPVTEYRVDHPGLSEAEALEQVMANVAASADVADFRARRMAPSAPGPERGYQTTDQTTGRDGGVASGESRRSESP